MQIRSIRFVSSLDGVNSDNDNVDVHVTLEDGRTFSVLVATPSNIAACMENEGIDYFFGTPTVYVKSLTEENVKRALESAASENNGYWFEVYAALQE